MTAAPDASPTGGSLEGGSIDRTVVGPTLRAAVKTECRRTLRSPFEIPLVVAGNATLLLLGWVFVPHSWLTRLHGAFALPLCLSMWMLADVPATNTLAPDRLRALATVDDPASLRRLLLAKNAALWLVATPLGLVATLWVGVQTGEWLTAGIVALGVAIVPFGLLGASSWVGIFWPYHPRPLSWRWQHRRPVGRTARWLLLVVLPYGLVPAISVVFVVPTFLVWAFVAKHGLGQRLSNLELALGSAVAIGVSIAASYATTSIALRFIRTRHDPLTAYLADPERG